MRGGDAWGRGAHIDLSERCGHMYAYTRIYVYAYAIIHVCPSISPSMPSVTMGIRPYRYGMPIVSMSGRLVVVVAVR